MHKTVSIKQQSPRVDAEELDMSSHCADLDPVQHLWDDPWVLTASQALSSNISG